MHMYMYSTHECVYDWQFTSMSVDSDDNVGGGIGVGVEVDGSGGNGGGAEGGEGTGEGTGESTGSEGANVMSPTGKALPPIEALAEAIFQVSAFAEECVKVEKNSELANAMINADIALCEIKSKLLEALEPLDQAA